VNCVRNLVSLKLRKCEGYCDGERSGVVISVGVKDFGGCRRN
jgi:hypothetical protein